MTCTVVSLRDIAASVAAARGADLAAARSTHLGLRCLGERLNALPPGTIHVAGGAGTEAANSTYWQQRLVAVASPRLELVEDPARADVVVRVGRSDDPDDCRGYDLVVDAR